MKQIRFLVIFPFIFLFLSINCTSQDQLKIISDFNRLDSLPEIIRLYNTFDINNSGGHIQGIQYFENVAGNYFFMTGSSDKYSYCLVVKLGFENRVFRLNKLMEKPFKHAGGFQIYQNYLAVGIEDNALKDKSKVCFYDISEPEKPLGQPLAVIERTGEPLRNTAGCVGITGYKNGILVAVGDWDTKHIDFYISESDKIVQNGFRKTGSIDTQNLNNKEWIDTDWNPYQNIILLNTDRKIYLVGLGQNKQAENVADLFEVNESYGNFSLRKIATRTFYCAKKNTFKAAAGVGFQNGVFKIISTGYNIDSVGYINVFGKY